MRKFCAVKPSLNITLGTYLGSINKWVKALENDGEVFLMIADLHTLAYDIDPLTIKEGVTETTKTYLSVFENINYKIIFVESEIPQITELFQIFSNYTQKSDLAKIIEAEGNQKFANNMGIFNCPILQTSDILALQPDQVLLNDNQSERYKYMEKLLKTTPLARAGLRLPQLISLTNRKKIYGLASPGQLMSVKLHEKDVIALRDTPDQIIEKINNINESHAIYQNLLNIFSEFTGKESVIIENEYQNINFENFKKDLAEVVITGLAPIQDRLVELDEDPTYVAKVLADGARKAGPIACATLSRVKEKIGLG